MLNNHYRMVGQISVNCKDKRSVAVKSCLRIFLLFLGDSNGKVPIGFVLIEKARQKLALVGGNL